MPFKIIGRITITTLIYLVYAECVCMLPCIFFQICSINYKDKQCLYIYIPCFFGTLLKICVKHVVVYIQAISEKSVLFIINGRVTSCMRKDGIRCRCTCKSSGCLGYPSTVGFSDVWDRVHWIMDILLKSMSQISLKVIDEEWKLLHDHPWMNLRQYSMGKKNIKQCI